MEVFAEIVRLTPQVLFPLCIAFILYFLGEAVVAIVRLALKRKKYATVGNENKARSLLKRSSAIFALGVCIEIVLSYGAAYISEDREQVFAKLYRQLLYTGILFFFVCAVICVKFRIFVCCSPSRAATKLIEAAHTRARRLGFALCSLGFLLFACGFVLWCNASYYAKLFDLDDPHGLFAVFGSVSFAVGFILYSGLAERLASWINSGK